MVGLGETDRRGARAPRATSATAGTDVATIGQYLQPTRRNLPGRRLHRAAAIRRVSRLRPVARLQGRLQRTAGAQFVYGRRGQRRGAARPVLNWLLALALRGAADPHLSPVRLSSGSRPSRWPRCWSRSRAKPGRGAASCSAGPPASSTGSASATGSSSCSRFTAGWASRPGGPLFLLFCCAKALHIGVFAHARRHPDAALVGGARRRCACGSPSK